MGEVTIGNWHNFVGSIVFLLETENDYWVDTVTTTKEKKIYGPCVISINRYYDGIVVKTSKLEKEVDIYVK